MMEILSILSVLAHVVEVVCSHTHDGKPTVIDLCQDCIEIAKTVDLSQNHTLATAQKDLINQP